MLGCFRLDYERLVRLDLLGLMIGLDARCLCRGYLAGWWVTNELVFTQRTLKSFSGVWLDGVLNEDVSVVVVLMSGVLM